MSLNEMIRTRRPRINHGGLTEVGAIVTSDRLKNYSVCMRQEENLPCSKRLKFHTQREQMTKKD
jgi:hypothetical protein